MTKEFCNSVITIPQINGTCWFNALMMMFFYSQNSRKLLLYYKPFKGKTDILSKTLKSILYKNYKLDKKTIEFFNENNIDSILSKFNLEPEIKDFVFKNGYLIPFFISHLFEAVKINYLTIDCFNTYSYSNFGSLLRNYYFGITETVSLFENYYNNQAYASILNDYNERQKYKNYIKEKVQNSVPLYLIINLWENNRYVSNYFGYNTNQILYDFNILNGYKFEATGIYELLNEITFNGRTYVLDSVSLGNYNYDNVNLGHAVAGITCKNNKYVYNGWIRNTNDPGIKNQIDRTLPCELMSYDWDVNKDAEFCINDKQCNLKGFIDRHNQLCFSFNKGNRTLIYILKNQEYKSLDFNKSKSSSYSSYSKSNSFEIKKQIKTEQERQQEELIRKRKEQEKAQEELIRKRREDERQQEELIRKRKEDERQQEKLIKKRKEDERNEEKEREREKKREKKKKKDEIKKEIKIIKENLIKYYKYKKELNKLIDNNKKKLLIILEKYKKYK